ncbi:ABC transporter ATP-binding protein/permease [Kingella negevensis]|uniref:Vitamin B12 transport ATP-binding protein BacA n=1 Tax=Kingella negevensis TaxID=1522312 RepID=A0A238T9U2_9NEIS|nr:ABC transporter ATP-binding protein/permease [Kingella negevensis]MDK4696452.1 ABC transporter ATP-binding protein/permease [Kingella negevensis]SNB64165.1 Vitamin B12 transport ATP-binding protein BacA [Kingella negevensis]
MQKWQTTLYATPVWLLQTLGGILIVVAIILALVSRTQFARQFRHVITPCLDKKSSLKIIAFIIAMLILLLTEVRLNVLSTFMSSGLYTSMQDMNVTAFWQFAAMNTAVVLLRTFNGAVNDFFDQALAIKWSERLNRVLITKWLAHKNYYHLQMRRYTPDNIDQRIQQDAQTFIDNTIEFVRGMLNSVISSLEFGIVLWGLAGVLNVFGISIPHGLVFAVFTFVILATFAAMWIGNPLIQYNYENERLNGDYRYSLIRVRDHAESVAFYHGETVEQQRLSQCFADIIRNRWRIARQSVGLSGFNDMFSQGIQLLPIILQAPRLFAGQIKIGDIQQTVQAFARLQKALSFFRLFYEQFTAYRARLERLSGFLASIETDPHPTQPERQIVSGSLKLSQVALLRPNGEILIDNINLNVKNGESLLIKGVSGCGKTSLLRLLANLWTHGGSGCICAPDLRETMFVPQRAYVPQGSLKEAICYPDLSPDEDTLRRALNDCSLAHLVEHLHKVKDWQHILSPGELQRIAFVRVLLAQPKLILLDESTAALDEPTETALYQLIRKTLPESMIVSVGHRSTLEALHSKSVNIVGGCDC